MEPVTGYARLGDQRIYYQTVGEGPPDLIINTGALPLHLTGLLIQDPLCLEL